MKIRILLFCLLWLLSAHAFAAEVQPGLVLWYKFDEGGGTVATDASGKGHTGTLVNGPAWVAGHEGGALRFNGVNNYIEVPANTLSNTTEAITIAFWCWGGDSEPKPNKIFEAIYSEGSMGVNVPHTNGVIYSDLPYPDRITKTANAADYKGRWNHWAFTKNATTHEQKIYCNGVEWANNIASHGTTPGGGQPIPGPNMTSISIARYFKSSTLSYYYEGLLDDFRIYNRALDRHTIARLAGKSDLKQAWYPEPTLYASAQSANASLSWQAGAGTAAHQIYFGASHSVVNTATPTSPEYKGQQAGLSFTPGPLKIAATYYWRVDEVIAGPSAPVKGPVWSFKVSGLIEGFESTNLWTGQRLKSATLVTNEKFTGTHSMCVAYDAAAISTAARLTRAFNTPQDWTGGNTLDVRVKGQTGNYASLSLELFDDQGRLLGKRPFTDSHLNEPNWKMVQADLVGLDSRKIGRVALVLSGGSGTGTFWLDDIELIDAPRSEMRLVNNTPILYVNNKPQVPMVLSTYGTAPANFDPLRKTYDKAYRHGVRLFYLGIIPSWWCRGVQAWGWVDEAITRYLEMTPEAWFFMNMNFSSGMVSADETFISNLGNKQGATVSNERWQNQSVEELRQYLNHMRSSYGSSQLMAVHPRILSMGESLYPYWNKYDEMGDYSPTNLAAFRNWLSNKYGADAAKLRAAWNDPAVTFATAAIPTNDETWTPNNGLLYNPAAGGTRMKVPDYFEFMSWVNANTLVKLGQATCGMDGGNALTGISSGYQHQLNRGICEGGQVNYSRVIRQSGMGYGNSPVSYLARHVGQISTVMGPMDSLGLFGKTHIHEDDSIYLMSDLQNDLSKALSVNRRNYFALTLRNHGLYFYDIGRRADGSSMFDIDEYWADVEKNMTISKATLFAQGQYKPQVMTFIDEDSILYTDNWASQLLLQQKQLQLEFIGAPIGYYNVADIADPSLLVNLPPAKLIVFHNLVKADPAKIARIRAWLEGKDVTVIWIWAPGLIGENGFDESAMRALTGITLKVDANARQDLRMRVTNSTHALTKDHLGETLGTSTYFEDTAPKPDPTQFGPLVYTDDPAAEKLADYLINPGTPRTAMAVKTVGSWRSVFYGSPGEIPNWLWRRLAQQAGAQVFDDQNDFVVANGSLIMIHTNMTAGNRTLNFPDNGDANYEVYEAFSDQTISFKPGPVTRYLNGGTTYLFAFGNKNRQLGLFPNQATDVEDIELATLRGLYGVHGYARRWYKNGILQAVLTGNTLSASLTLPGEVWRCELLIDGTVFGEASITIKAVPGQDDKSAVPPQLWKKL